jgi:hypothetical protein
MRVAKVTAAGESEDKNAPIDPALFGGILGGAGGLMVAGVLVARRRHNKLNKFVLADAPDAVVGKAEAKV